MPHKMHIYLIYIISEIETENHDDDSFVKISKRSIQKTSQVYFCQNASFHRPTSEINKCFVCSKFDESTWIWILDLKSFEPVHGLSRIVKLIPDKLWTAIEINKEKLQDPKDDGSFLIDLLIELLLFYQQQVQVCKYFPFIEHTG